MSGDGLIAPNNIASPTSPAPPVILATLLGESMRQSGTGELCLSWPVPNRVVEGRAQCDPEAARVAFAREGQG
ncbi:hypothetical protein GCM10009843_32990 [Nocardioides bigeumensis]|uniref:Uncharacterized protein n=1 Tax=Nocardioides bigeumensis TaxID=433657 RepID=A0ABN2YRW3_9ACTN